MIAAQRESAAIVSLANRVLAGAQRAVLSGLSVDAARTAVVSECAALWEFTAANIEILGREGRALVPEGATVATLSSSSAVSSILESAHEAGVGFDVLAAESRPALEGLELVGRLVEAGVHARLVSDAALPGLVSRCGLALVGADSVSEESFVNKTGTYPLALAAREAGVPFHVAALEDRFIPSAARGELSRGRPPDELVGRDAPGVPALNLYFEETPLALVTGLVTERGPLPAADVAERVRGNPISFALLQILYPKPPAPDVS